LVGIYVQENGKKKISDHRGRWTKTIYLVVKDTMSLTINLLSCYQLLYLNEQYPKKEEVKILIPIKEHKEEYCSFIKD